MRVMLPNVKAHIAVAMVAFLVTSMAMEDMTHEGVTNYSPAMELMNTASIKRQLRSSPDMTGGDATNHGERRLVFSIEGISTKVVEVLRELIAATRVSYSDTLFKKLKLEVNDRLFSKPEFTTWEEMLVYKYGLAAFEKMTKTILRQSDDVTAAKVIFATESDPINILQLQLLNRWKKRKVTPDTLLHLLVPGNDAESLVDNSLYNAWWEFVDSYKWKKAQMFASLTTNFGADNLAMAIAKGHNFNVMNADKPFERESRLGQLYVRQLHVWKEAHKSEEDVGKLLTLESAGSTFPSTFLASTWLDYVLVRASITFDHDEDLKDAVLRHVVNSPVKKLLESEDIEGPLLTWKEKLLSEKYDENAWSVKNDELQL